MTHSKRDSPMCTFHSTYSVCWTDAFLLGKACCMYVCMYSFVNASVHAVPDGAMSSFICYVSCREATGEITPGFFNRSPTIIIIILLCNTCIIVVLYPMWPLESAMIRMISACCPCICFGKACLISICLRFWRMIIIYQNFSLLCSNTHVVMYL